MALVTKEGVWVYSCCPFSGLKNIFKESKLNAHGKDISIVNFLVYIGGPEITFPLNCVGTHTGLFVSSSLLTHLFC